MREYQGQKMVSQNAHQALYSAIVDTPLPVQDGKLGIVVTDEGLSRIDFVSRDHSCFVSDACVGKQGATLKLVLQQLQSYFENPRRVHVEISMAAQGTRFQRTVWQHLAQSNSGQWTCYGELASLLGSSARAVGNACRRNPIPILVPCHRVLAKTGLGGFAGKQQGEYLQIKQWLLQHEQGQNRLLPPASTTSTLTANIWHNNIVISL